MTLIDKIVPGKLPQHVAVIMDGNGRWAACHGSARITGHEHGVEAVKSTVEGASEIGIKYLTLYAFSMENWSRPKDEVDALMNLLIQAIHSETQKLKEHNITLRVIGDFSSLPDEVQKSLAWCVSELKDGTGLTAVLALSYSARWEIAEAVRKIALDVRNGHLKVEDIQQELVGQYLTTNGIPDPELLIRTSGERRLSNFLLWQIAYSELYFTPVFWPDFRKEHLFEAICDFQSRERRFGKTGQQLVS